MPASRRSPVRRPIRTTPSRASRRPSASWPTTSSRARCSANTPPSSSRRKTVAIIDDRTAYGQGLADEFKKAADAAGVKVVADEYTNDKATDFEAILTKIKGKKPDLVFYGGMDAQGGPMAKQMKELGIKAKFLGGDGGCTPEFIKLAGEATEGHYCSLPGVPLREDGRAVRSSATSSPRSSADIQLYAPYVYDAVMVMVDAMKRADSVEPAKYPAEPSARPSTRASPP